MYVSKKDEFVISQLMGLLQNSIEGMSEPGEYWTELSNDAHRLEKKMIKASVRNSKPKRQ